MTTVHWIREQARFTLPTSWRRTISRDGFHQRLRTVFDRSSWSAGGVSSGLLIARRIEVRPFTPPQIKLLETFADQAVIAIENVRLFKELEARTRELARSVGELKALGEVGQAVSSTLDLQPCSPLIVRHAVQLSEPIAASSTNTMKPSEEFHLRASHQMEEELVEALSGNPMRLGKGPLGGQLSREHLCKLLDLLEEQEFAARGMRPICHSLAIVRFWLCRFFGGADHGRL